MSAAEDVVVDAAADVVVEDKVTPSFLDMSDADMLNATPPTLDGSAAVVEEKTEVVAEADPEDTTAVVAEPAATDAVKEEKTEVKDEKIVPEVDKTKLEEKKPEAEKEVVAAVDFEAEYKRLLAPFKANGREIAVTTVDDAIDLMKMGANYNKKMAALKPSLKIMKMLESNGFLSEDKIGFLIDLGRKDPAAINKLVKDAGIDPMDLDGEKAGTYKQTTYAVDDREIELDTVLDELQGSPAYTRTLDVVSNKWDVASKQVVSQNPQLLKVISDHVASGIYDQISTEVERERVFGRLKGLSDIDAYRHVGDAIEARGGFNHLAKAKQEAKPAAPVVVVPKPKVVVDDKLKDKRRAASSPQLAPATGVVKDFNPLSMADDEFDKLAAPKFA